MTEFFANMKALYSFLLSKPWFWAYTMSVFLVHAGITRSPLFTFLDVGVAVIVYHRLKQAILDEKPKD